ncbi:hypothetical protein H1C71_005157 [Ictidomys tridecemlineatus]|nr:hypothetical protein H1C71_005157 [Ictidomys tridecemlineatus]
MVILIKRSWKHPLEEKSQAEFFGHSRGMPFPFPLMTTVNILSELQTRVLNCSPDISTCVSCTLFKSICQHGGVRLCKAGEDEEDGMGNGLVSFFTAVTKRPNQKIKSFIWGFTVSEVSVQAAGCVPQGSR